MTDAAIMEFSLKSLFDKVWEQHVVVPESDDTPAVLYIDLHLIHEVSTTGGVAEGG